MSQLKPKKFSNVSLFKASDVDRIQPKTIFLGSSRTDLDLDPDHPALSDIQLVHNLALLGPNMYESKRYFEHALANQPDLKRVVVGIDFLSFNEYFGNKIGFDESQLGKRRLPRHDLTQTILSLDGLGASLETINSNIHSDAFYLYKENGRRYVYEGDLDRLSMQATFQSSISEAAGGTYRRYRLSQKYLSNLQYIIQTCREKNIELKIFISPIYATHLETLRKSGYWSEFETWKREVVKITAVWNFTGYNSITTEPISKGMKNFWDSAHYRKEVGDLILDCLFNYETQKVPDDFGTLVTSQNIESHLKKIRDEQSVWISNNPSEVKLVASVMRKFRR